MSQKASGTHESLFQDTGHFQLLVDAVTEYAIYTLDQEGRVATWNTGAKRIKGYEASEILGKQFQIFFPEEKRAAGWPEALLEQARTKGIAKDEGWRVRKDGSRFMAEVVLTPIFDHDSALRGYAKVTRDISDRKITAELQELNEKLVQSENQISIILEGVNSGVTAQDATGKLIFANAAAAHTVGYASAEELLRAPVSDIVARFRFIDENGAPFPVEKMPSRLVLSGHESKPVVLGYQEIATGLEQWSLVKSSPFRDAKGQITMAINFFHDITDLKRQALDERKAKEQLRVILEGIAEAICVQDAKGKLLYLNQAFAMLLGFTSTQEVMDLAADPEKSANIQKNITVFDEGGNAFPREATPGRLALQGKTPDPITLRFRMSNDSKQRWVISSAKPIFDDHGNLSLAISILHDVTELKESELMLRQSQKMEGIGKLAGGIAHDFNNLLTVINGYSEFLLSSLSEKDSLTYQYVNEIRSAGERAASLTQQLLAFSRKQMLVPKIFDLNEVLQGMDALLQRVIGENIELRTIQGADRAKIKADQGQIEQVILNLVLNSRDAMPEGGKLTMETAIEDLDEGYVSTHLESKCGKHIMLAITDTGTGIDPYIKEHLFEPFFTTKGTGKGTGLGLSTVFGIIKQSGGSINVYSELGSGTTFKVYLPIAENLSPPVSTETNKSGSVEKPEVGTILIVEDEAGVRKLVQQTLTACGYTCLTAEDAESALSLSKSHLGHIDMLLTDVVLPHINGRRLAEMILELRPDIKILYMSGYTDNAIVHNGVLNEGTELINKPFSGQTLKHRVRQRLAEKV